MQKLTDNDRHLGPITYGKTSFGATRLVFSSGSDRDSDENFNNLTGYLCGWIARIYLPNILRPYREKHMALSWDAETVERLGRNYYHEEFPQEYGFSLSDGFLQIFLGAQTHDSNTTRSWSKFLPWTQWRFIRSSLYAPDGSHFWTRVVAKRNFNTIENEVEAQKLVPSINFDVEDFDGQKIVVNCHIEEREWHFGEGWFKWLSLFVKPKIYRSLDLQFNKEVGPDKGSWKGGMLAHSIEMLPEESCESAFSRYCDQEHRSKYDNYKIKFINNQKLV